MGKCDDSFIYKIDTSYLGSSGPSFSIALGYNFGLSKAPIYAILRKDCNWKTSYPEIKIYRIFQQLSVNTNGDYFINWQENEKIQVEKNIKKLEKCPEIVGQIEQKYQIILTQKTLQKIQDDFPFRFDTPSNSDDYYLDFVKEPVKK